MRRRELMVRKIDLSNRIITYTSKSKINPNINANVWGTNLVSNEYDEVQGTGKMVFDDNVVAIGMAAFDSQTDLISITLPESVIRIGDFAFQGCSNLSLIHWGDKIESISGAAFYGCTSLTKIIIPESLT